VANPTKCLLWFALAIALCLPTLCSADTYEYQYFIWGPSSQDMIYNAVPDPTPGVYDGYTGTFYYIDQTLVNTDFGWQDMGTSEGSDPPGPWIEYGTVTDLVSWHIAYTEFEYSVNGTVQDIILPDTEISDKTFADPHAEYLADPPVPEPASMALFAIGVGFAGVYRRLRR